jgi:hypothetical protein
MDKADQMSFDKILFQDKKVIFFWFFNKKIDRTQVQDEKEIFFSSLDQPPSYLCEGI